VVAAAAAAALFLGATTVPHARASHNGGKLVDELAFTKRDPSMGFPFDDLRWMSARFTWAQLLPMLATARPCGCEEDAVSFCTYDTYDSSMHAGFWVWGWWGYSLQAGGCRLCADKPSAGCHSWGLTDAGEADCRRRCEDGTAPSWHGNYSWASDSGLIVDSCSALRPVGTLTLCNGSCVPRTGCLFSTTRAHPTLGPLNGGTNVTVSVSGLDPTLIPSTSIQCRFGNTTVQATLIAADTVVCTSPSWALPGAQKLDIRMWSGGNWTNSGATFTYSDCDATTSVTGCTSAVACLAAGGIRWDPEQHWCTNVGCSANVSELGLALAYGWVDFRVCFDESDCGNVDGTWATNSLTHHDGYQIGESAAEFWSRDSHNLPFWPRNSSGVCHRRCLPFEATSRCRTDADCMAHDATNQWRAAQSECTPSCLVTADLSKPSCFTSDECASVGGSWDVEGYEEIWPSTGGVVGWRVSVGPTTANMSRNGTTCYRQCDVSDSSIRCRVESECLNHSASNQWRNISVIPRCVPGCLESVSSNQSKLQINGERVYSCYSQSKCEIAGGTWSSVDSTLRGRSVMVCYAPCSILCSAQYPCSHLCRSERDCLNHNADNQWLNSSLPLAHTYYPWTQCTPSCNASVQEGHYKPHCFSEAECEATGATWAAGPWYDIESDTVTETQHCHRPCRGHPVSECRSERDCLNHNANNQWLNATVADPMCMPSCNASVQEGHYKPHCFSEAECEATGATWAAGPWYDIESDTVTETQHCHRPCRGHPVSQCRSERDCLNHNANNQWLNASYYSTVQNILYSQCVPSCLASVQAGDTAATSSRLGWRHCYSETECQSVDGIWSAMTSMQGNGHIYWCKMVTFSLRSALTFDADISTLPIGSTARMTFEVAFASAVAALFPAELGVNASDVVVDNIAAASVEVSFHIEGRGATGHLFYTQTMLSLISSPTTLHVGVYSADTGSMAEPVCDKCCACESWGCSNCFAARPCLAAGGRWETDRSGVVTCISPCSSPEYSECQSEGSCLAINGQWILYDPFVTLQYCTYPCSAAYLRYGCLDEDDCNSAGGCWTHTCDECDYVTHTCDECDYTVLIICLGAPWVPLTAFLLLYRRWKRKQVYASDGSTTTPEAEQGVDEPLSKPCCSCFCGLICGVLSKVGLGPVAESAAPAMQYESTSPPHTPASLHKTRGVAAEP
jgi:hypothetical protein